MLARFYLYAWLAIAFAFLGVVFIEGLTITVLAAFSFIALGMIFVGMMDVLPATISHPATEPIRASKQISSGSVGTVVGHRIHSVRV